MSTERRANPDPRVDGLIEDAKAIHEELANNTRITLANHETINEVRDVLASFRVLSKVCKWLTVVVIFVTSLIALVKGVISLQDFKDAITAR